MADAHLTRATVHAVRYLEGTRACIITGGLQILACPFGTRFARGRVRLSEISVVSLAIPHTVASHN